MDKVHNKGDLRALNPVLVYRSEEVFLFMVRHTARGKGTVCVGCVLTAFQADLGACWFFSRQHPEYGGADSMC